MYLPSHGSDMERPIESGKKEKDEPVGVYQPKLEIGYKEMKWGGFIDLIVIGWAMGDQGI